VLLVKEKKRLGRPTKLPPDARSFLIRLPAGLLQDLRTFAGSKGISANETIWTALEDWWGRQPEHDAIVAIRLPASPVSESSKRSKGSRRSS
jgi:hypothetical protein